MATAAVQTPAWASRERLDAAGLRAADAELRTSGYALVQLSSRPGPSGPLYAGVWAADGPPSTEAVVDRTAAQLEQDVAERAARGCGVRNLTGCEIGGEVLYAAVFEACANPLPSVRLGLDRAALERELESMRADGGRPRFLAGFEAGGASCFALVSVAGDGPAWMLDYDLSRARFRTLLHVRLQRGFRPAFVETWTVDGTPRYAGLWTAGRGQPLLVRTDVPHDELGNVLATWQRRGFALSHLSTYAAPPAAALPKPAYQALAGTAGPASAGADAYTATLAKAAPTDPAAQFVHDLLTNPQLASDWTAAVAKPGAAPVSEADQYLDNWLAQRGYDCDVEDVGRALDKMKLADLAFWTGVYGKTTLGSDAGPPLVVTGNGIDAVTVDGIVIHDWTYANGSLRWTTAMNGTAGNLTFAQLAAGTDGAVPGMRFAGTLTTPATPGSAGGGGPHMYQGTIGPLPATAETAGVQSAQVAFNILNDVINVVQAARILYRGGELVAEYGPKLLQAAQARLGGTPLDVEGEAPAEAGESAGEAGEGVAEGAGEAIGEATGETIGEAAGTAAVDAASEAAVEAGIEIGAAAAPEIAEGIGAAAAAAL